MQAHMWGIKTFYYSLINKQGAKAAPEDRPGTTDEQKFWNAIKAPVAQQYDDLEDDCESCKL